MIGALLGHWTYLVTTIIIGAVIIIGAELLHTHTLRDEWRLFALAIGVGLVQGIPMSHFSMTMDAYEFGSEYTLGIALTAGPIEDVAFAIVVPAFIAAVTIYFYHHRPEQDTAS